jgi:hypothetical protein
LTHWSHCYTFVPFNYNEGGNIVFSSNVFVHRVGIRISNL